MDTALHTLSIGRFQRPSRRTTRERPTIDRIACPWLVLRFLDPQSAGLLAMSLRLLRLHAGDHTMLAAALPLDAALYAWCQGARGQSQGWKPAAMAGAAQ
ncbi:MAG: chromate resistance protein [Ramlibacter sp.]|nr:chromate resistance protein [Ramlibacter sp.]